jgi:hypothetical protein
MHKTRIWITMGCCLFALAIFAWAQSSRKPGLWEITTTISMAGMQMPQMPQLPPGVTLPQGMTMPSQGSPFGGPTTVQVCLTQAMIDKYGGASPAPPNKNADCKVTDISIQSSGMTAKINCTGQMTATGTVEATFVDANTTKTKMHMTGAMQHGANSMPVDMTMLSTSVYKGADCGSVKPLPLPKN